MENDSPPQRSFLQAFFGSFVCFGDYQAFAQRSVGSALGHFVLLVTLVCSLYAGLASYWLKTNVDPFLQSTVAQIPEIHIKNGVASTDLPQPHIIKIENEPVFIIDTTADPKIYLDKYPAIGVLSANSFTTKQTSGKIETHALSGDFDLDAVTVNGWLEAIRAWTLPLMFMLAFGWQLCWKSIQLLLTAGVVTLINSSKPGFSTHLRLACYAMSPAMGWGLLVFGLQTAGVPIPFAGSIFWCILVGLTVLAAGKIKNTPKYH